MAITPPLSASEAWMAFRLTLYQVPKPLLALEVPAVYRTPEKPA